MSDDNFRYNRHDRDSWESAGDARIRQREVHEKRVAGEREYNNRINANAPRTTPIGSESYSSEPVEISNFALYVGVPLILFAVLIWMDFVPLAEVQIMGYPLATVSFWAGVVCTAFRFVVRVAAIGLMGIGGIGIFGTVVALIGGVPFSDVTGTLALSGVAIGIGLLILRASISKQ